MKHFYSILLSCIFVMHSIAMLADEDCDATLQEAKIAYNAGNYSKAKQYYDYVVEICGGSYGNASSWSQKCQEALTPKLSVSRTNISVSAYSGTTSITVTSNRTWELTNTSSSLFTVSRSGDNVYINYSANPNTTTRSDYFDVVTTDGAKSVRIYITQQAKAASAPYLTVNKTSISASSSGTTEYITVSSNVAWEIQYPSATMYSVTRNGDTLTVKINANASTESRTAYFNVKTTDGTKTIKVSLSQAGKINNTSNNSTSKTSTLLLSKTYISASSYGTTDYITVTCNTAWEIQFPTATMYSVTRNGNTLTVKINANTSTDSRSDYFNVKTTDGSKVVKVTLTQSASTYNSSNSYSSSNSSYSSSNRIYYRPTYYQKVQDWYGNAGRIECSWWSPKLFVGTNWGFEVSYLDFRLWWFEMEPFAIGVKLNYHLDYQLYYMPKVKFYIPMSERWSMSIAVGPTFDIGDSYDYFKNPWFTAELAFRCHHRNSCVNTDLFMRYNDGFVAGVAWSFTKAWRTR